ncbi:MAG: ATP-binding protein [Proteobacteria bacterium]|nr:MAG: ATP-binding protein [Pseudomonadota bacterium]
MILKTASQITKDDIDALVEEGVRESRAIEYKAKLPESSDSAKKEFLADISAFANSSGGHIFFGLGEARDPDGSNTGSPTYLGLTDFNADIEIRRLEQMVNLGIEPAIPGIEIKSIDGFESGPILVISIPQSWNAPHVVTFKDTSRFFLRTNAGKAQMDVSQIRRAFLDSTQIESKIASFRSSRIESLLNDRAPLPTGKGGILLIHWIPLNSMMTSQSLDVGQVKNAAFNATFTEAMLNRSRFNLDGYLKYSTDSGDRSGNTEAYIQFFRNGCVEAADFYALEVRDGKPLVYSPDVEKMIGLFVPSLARYAKKMALAGPYVLAVSLLRVKGFTLQLAHHRTVLPPHPVDRDNLILPEQFLDDLSAEPMALVKPTLDALWNALGEEQCTHFDREGAWRR